VLNFDPSGPWVVKTSEPPDTIAHELQAKASHKDRIEIFDGRKMRTKTQFMEQFGSRFEFPDWFEGGMNSFIDLMRHVDLVEQKSLAILITNSSDLLSDEGDLVIDEYLTVLNDIGDNWANRQRYTSLYPDPRGFHVILA
jgi:hypothetical protein